MSTPDRVSHVDHTGLLLLRNAVPADVVAAMSDAIWHFLATRHARRRDDPATWTRIAGRTGLQSLTRAGVFDGLREQLRPRVDALLGVDAWKEPAHWGHPLITFPSPGTLWEVPVAGWHVDSHRWSRGAVPGLVAFTFVEQVRPRGGGTLVVSGSHHLTWRLCQRAGGFARTSEMKAALADQNRWFADLWTGPSGDPERTHRYLEAGAVVDGVDVRVVELCGEPGDVVLMNPRCFHATGPNAAASPRLMLSDFLDRVGGGCHR
jgi:ectoine hydroxylase-related dioxygenase (phytanoyl-CoA dioxygenase family)